MESAIDAFFKADPSFSPERARGARREARGTRFRECSGERERGCRVSDTVRSGGSISSLKQLSTSGRSRSGSRPRKYGQIIVLGNERCRRSRSNEADNETEIDNDRERERESLRVSNAYRTRTFARSIKVARSIFSPQRAVHCCAVCARM